MKTIAELRRYRYDYYFKECPYLNAWKKNPYTWFKARFYIEMGALLVYFLLKTKIKPNTVTITYGLLGLCGGILLAIPINQTILIAILIFFSKGILDWSDGHLARIRGQISITGDILDGFGAQVGWISLWSGMGIYIANKSGIAVFYYLTPIIPIVFALDITSFARIHFYNRYLNKSDYFNIKENENKLPIKASNDNDKFAKIKKIKMFVDKMFEHRARFVDFICLIILIEVLFSTIFISWFIYLIFLSWQVITFLGKFFIFSKEGWAEKEIQRKLNEIYKG